MGGAFSGARAEDVAAVLSCEVAEEKDETV